MDFNFTEDIVLENDRVRIAPLTEVDAVHLLPVAAEDKSLVQYSPYAIHEPAQLRSYVTNSLQDKADRIRYPFSVFDKKMNTYAGSTSFANISNADKRLEIGWTWIGPRFQGTGLNTSLKFLLLRYVFETLDFERAEFKTDERNLQSRKALEKIGARIEGVFRSHTVLQDGFRRNTVYYSILKSEWAQVAHKLLAIIH
jgi:RimJ/RimL family protein N-acetyltransferase